MTDIYYLITELFKDSTIRGDLNDFSDKLRNQEVKDFRIINELVSFYSNIIFEQLEFKTRFKTTRYNEKIYCVNGTHDIFPLKNNDFSYKLVVDKSDYFDHTSKKTYRYSFKSSLRGYILSLFEELSNYGFFSIFNEFL